MIGQKKEKPKAPQEDEGWLLTYADFITLMMAFFVMLVATMKPDAGKMEEVTSSISKKVGGRDIIKPIDMLKTDLREVVQSVNAEEKVGVGVDEDGVVMELASASFFKSSSADLMLDGIPILKRLASTINAERYRHFQVQVQGHTDDVPINTQQFPSNWELSAARATTTVRFFISTGVIPSRLIAVGMADIAPKVANRDAEGKPLAENQSINRRVVVKLVPRQH